jgi:hypothetical protein
MIEYDNLSKDIFINHLYANKTLSWASTDGLEDYINNKKDVPEHYKDNPIEYKFNSYGYRSPEFTSVEDDEFMLVCGCSHTMGIGNRLEDLWWSKLGEYNDLPVINLAQESFGTDYMFAVTNQWISKQYAKPRIAIYQHPFLNRVMKVYMSNKCDVYTDSLDPAETHLMATNAFMYANYVDAITNMWNAQGVPCFHWCFDPDANGINVFSSNNVLTVTGEDVGRDLTHDGQLSHANAAIQLEPLVKAGLHKGRMRSVNDPIDPTTFTTAGGEYSVELAMQQSIHELRSQQDTIYD